MTTTPSASRVPRAGIRRGLVLLLAVASAGCGARTGAVQTVDAELGPARAAIDGLGGRRCEYLNGAALPASLDAVTRPGTRGSVMMWATGAAPGDTIEVSVRYDADGALGWVMPLRNTAAPGRFEELERLLSAGLEPRGPGDSGFRLRFVGGALEGLLPSVICRPEHTGGMPRVLPPMGNRQEMAEAMRARQGYYPVDMSLDEHGRVVGVRLAYTTGSRLIDEHLLDVARLMAFRPKLHDGMGVPTTTTIRFRFNRR